MSAKQKQSKVITMQAITDITQGISIHPEQMVVFCFFLFFLQTKGNNSSKI